MPTTVVTAVTDANVAANFGNHPWEIEKLCKMYLGLGRSSNSGGGYMNDPKQVTVGESHYSTAIPDPRRSTTQR